MILAAYAIRKAYKKHEAKKAQEKLPERGNYAARNSNSSEDARPTRTLSARRHSAHLGRSVTSGLIDYESSNGSSAAPAEPASPWTRSTYSASMYSQPGISDPLDEFRQYQQYVSRQSYVFEKDADPPSYEHAIDRPPEQLPSQPTHGTTTGSWMRRARESYHADEEPQSPPRITELDTSSESSAATRGRSRSSTQQVQEMLDSVNLEHRSATGEFSAERPAPPRIRKSQEQAREKHVLSAGQGARSARKRIRHSASDSDSDSDGGNEHRGNLAKPFETAERSVRTG